MGEELAGWAAFVGAVLMIGLEFWRARKSVDSGNTPTAGTDSTPVSRADRFFLTRGVSALSVIGVGLTALGAFALHAFSVSLQLDAQYVRDCIGETCFGTTADQLDAAKLDLFVSVIDLAVVLLWCAVAVLCLRVVLYCLIRVAEWATPALREVRAKHNARTADEISPDAKQVGGADAGPTRRLPQKRSADS